MENAIGTVVAYWFVASVWLTGAAVVAWLAWNVSRMVRGRQKKKGKGENVTTWVCQECGCDIAEYGVCRCFDDEMEFFCAECAKENHEVELIVKNKKSPASWGTDGGSKKGTALI